MDKIQGSLRGVIGRRGFGHCAVVPKKFDGFGDALGSGFCDIDMVTTIVLQGSSDVPSIDTMWLPGTPVGWCFVHENFGAKTCKWGAVVVEISIQLGFSGKSGVQAHRP
jgi:hypothetical protein